MTNLGSLGARIKVVHAPDCVAQGQRGKTPQNDSLGSKQIIGHENQIPNLSNNPCFSDKQLRSTQTFQNMTFQWKDN